MKRLALWVVIAAMLSFSVLGGQAYLDIPVLEDTLLQNGDRADNNYATLSPIETGVHSDYLDRSLLKFDLSSIDKEIVYADLLLYQVGGPGTTPIHIYLTEDTWAATTATWNLAPAYSTEITQKELVVGSGYKNFDVTTGVLAELAGDDIISFTTIGDETALSSNYKLFFSSETPNGPVLRVYYETFAPVITPTLTPINADEGDLVDFSYIATDTENDIIIYEVYIDGVLMEESSSFSWQTDFTTAGAHQIKFYVEDATGLFDEYTFEIIIDNKETIVINEFFPIAPPNSEWIELFNPTDSDFDVGDCAIYIGTTGYTLTGTIPVGGFGLIGGLSVMDNTGETITINCNEILQDSVTYGGDGAPLPAGGESVGRKQDGLDTDVDSADFTIFSEPTPNSENTEYNDADTNFDGCVGTTELLTYIGLWKADPIGIPMINLLDAIALWKSNPIC